jgi:hypothetical protein
MPKQKVQFGEIEKESTIVFLARIIRDSLPGGAEKALGSFDFERLWRIVDGEEDPEDNETSEALIRSEEEPKSKWESDQVIKCARCHGTGDEPGQ